MNDQNEIQISVAMAVYNCRDTIQEAIDSILKQTFQDFELIICDDCSTDGTYETVQDYAAKYPNKIVLLRNERNSKLAFSLNNCLEHARGRYVARMDGDDISLPTRFEEQVKFLDEHPEFAVVSCAIIPFDEHGDRGLRRKLEYPDRFALLFNPCFNHATIMMRKPAYDHLGGYTVSRRTERGQDYDLWFRFFAAGYKGFNLQEPLYKVREDSNTFCRRTLKRRLFDVQTMFLGYRALNYPPIYYICILKQLVAGCIPHSLMNYYRRSKDRKTAYTVR